MINEKKYVVLEHLTLPDRGFRFWSTNGEDNTHGYNGELWYKEVLFTDEENTAILASREINMETIPNMHELEEYYRQKMEKEDNEN